MKPKLSEKEMMEILRKVKLISETDRNPDWKDNRRRMLAGKRCPCAAYPKDLGANRRHQEMTQQLRRITALGYLKEGRMFLNDFPYFSLTQAGKTLLR